MNEEQMDSNGVQRTKVLAENEENLEKLVAPQAAPRKYQIAYIPLIVIGYVHVAAVYGTWLCLTSVSWSTIIFLYVILMASDVGITAGVHRLWTHKSYKAKLPLQIILMFFFSIAQQNSALNWVKDHRMHHKYSDTDADPHNATRGLFYSHIGWALVKKHAEYKKRRKYLDLSDLYSNPVVSFQHRYAFPVIMTASIIFPTAIPMYFWNETFNNAWHANILRYVISLNITCLVNSFAHSHGYRPYDKSIIASQRPFIAFLALGEGFHNFHHCFPFDYRTAELGNDWLNLTTKFIEFFAWIGWAYDLKTAPAHVVSARCARTGDGTDLWGRSRPTNHGTYKVQNICVNNC